MKKKPNPSSAGAAEKTATRRNHYVHWTLAEIAYLETHYGRIPAREIASTLGRGISGGRSMAGKVGMCRSGGRDGSRYIYQLMSEHLRLHKARFRQLTRLSAGERLAGFIYDLAVRYGFQGCAVRDFRLPMLRCDIANYIGVTPETVTREIIKLVDAGAFLFSGKHVSGLRASIMAQRAGDMLSCRNDEPLFTTTRGGRYGQ